MQYETATDRGFAGQQYKSNIQAPPPAPESELDRELENLTRVAVELASMVNLLGERLSPVIIPMPEESNAQNTARPSCGSRLGQSINNATAEISGSIQRLRGLVDSLAL